MPGFVESLIGRAVAFEVFLMPRERPVLRTTFARPERAASGSARRS